MTGARDTGAGPPWLLAAVSAVFVFGAPAVAWFLIRPARRALARRAV